jgi:hypothetical protein
VLKDADSGAAQPRAWRQCLVVSLATEEESSMSPDEHLTDVAESEVVPWTDEGDDEEPVSREAVTHAVVTDTDWTAETILSQLRRGNIQLNPRFQRRDAWDATRKSRVIESLILGLPIPQLVLAEDKRRRGAFIVLDGKQRLLTLRQFAEGSVLGVGPAAGEFRELRLSRLDVRPDLHGYNLARLEDEPDKLDDLNALLNQTVRTVVVRRWPDEDFLNLVFLRLNTGSVPLSPQELRQALHRARSQISSTTLLLRVLKFAERSEPMPPISACETSRYSSDILHFEAFCRSIAAT